MERIIPISEEARLMRILSGQPCPNENCKGKLTITIPYNEGLVVSCTDCKVRVDVSNVRIKYEIQNDDNGTLHE